MVPLMKYIMLIFMVICSFSSSGAPLVYSGNQLNVFDTDLMYFFDASAQREFPQIKFMTFTKDVPSSFSGKRNETYWIKFKLSCEKKCERVLLLFNFMFFNSVDLYLTKVNGELVFHQRSGVMVDQQQKNLRGRVIGFSFTPLDEQVL